MALWSCWCACNRTPTAASVAAPAALPHTAPGAEIDVRIRANPGFGLSPRPDRCISCTANRIRCVRVTRQEDGALIPAQAYRDFPTHRNICRATHGEPRSKAAKVQS